MVKEMVNLVKWSVKSMTLYALCIESRARHTNIEEQKNEGTTKN